MSGDTRRGAERMFSRIIDGLRETKLHALNDQLPKLLEGTLDGVPMKVRLSQSIEAEITPLSTFLGTTGEFCRIARYQWLNKSNAKPIEFTACRTTEGNWVLKSIRTSVDKSGN